MLQLITLFISTLIIYVLLDFIWLGLIAKNIYMSGLGHLLRTTNGEFAPNWLAMAVVYILMALGIILFVVPRAQNDYFEAARWGALFGLIVYGVYNFTNITAVAQWPLTISLIDITWGMIVCTLVSMFATFMLKWLA